MQHQDISQKNATSRDLSLYINHPTNQHKILMTKFSNILMKKGEKHVSEKILIKTFQLLRKSKMNSAFFLKTALRRVKPLVEVKNKKKGSRKKVLKAIPIKTFRGYKLAID